MKRIVVCGANSYEEKYYLNPLFSKVPQSIQNELQILCVLFTHEVGGIFLLEFDENGKLQMKTEAAEGDFSFDEIGSALRIKEVQREKQELLQSIELYYKMLISGHIKTEQDKKKES